MKILFLADKMDIGGAETHIATLIEALCSSHHEITLASAGGVFADRLIKGGIKHIKIPFDGRTPLSVIRSYFRLRGLIRDFDLVHAHTRFTAFLAGLARGRAKFPRIVTTAHLDFPRRGLGRLSYWGDATLAVSEDIKDYLIENYSIPEDRITVTVNGIDTEHFSDIPQYSKNIIHLSRIDKGRSECALSLVKIAGRLFEKYPNHRIVIAGGGNLFGELSALVKKKNSELGCEYIKLTGPVSDAATVLSIGGIFVGVSRAALEAMAMGIPTVIAGDDGYGGIIGNDNIELLKKSNLCARGLGKIEENKLFSDISALLDNESLRGRLSRFSYNEVRQSFSVQRMANDALNAYESAKFNQKALLVGYFGFGNLGDEETLIAAKSALSAVGITRTSVLSEKSGYKRRNPLSILTAIRRSDTVIFAGGTLLQNETSLASLLYYSAIIFVANLMARRVFLLSSGVGEIRGALAKWVFGRDIRSIYRLGLRTEGDIEYIKDIRQDAKIMPDLCFFKNREPHPHRDKSFAVFASECASLSNEIIEKIGNISSLSPTVIALFHKEDKDIAECLGGADGYFSPNDLPGVERLISGADFTVSARLHGGIFSVISHKICFLYRPIQKNEFFIREIEKRAERLGTRSPVFGFSSGDELLSLVLSLKKKEIEVDDLDFRVLINDFARDINSAIRDFFN